MIGACFALWVDAVDPENATSLWVLPFSAGGFLNIALVSVLPELMKEENPKENCIQLGFMLLGISVMSVLCMALNIFYLLFHWSLAWTPMQVVGLYHEKQRN